jgi:hypothetical protein
VDLADESDQPLVIGAFTLTLSVFILDSLMPSEIAVFVLYVVPLGLTRWSNIKHLTFILTGVVTVLIIFAHLLNPGTIQEVATTNRILGIVMVWTVAFFLKVERF